MRGIRKWIIELFGGEKQLGCVLPALEAVPLVTLLSWQEGS